MKQLLIFATAAALTAAAVPALADHGRHSVYGNQVSGKVGHSDYYGRIETDQRPRVIYSEPIYTRPTPYAYGTEPVYLRVRPGQEDNWSRHCWDYDACNQPVYFVQDRWYRDTYLVAREPMYDRSRESDGREGNPTKGPAKAGKQGQKKQRPAASE